MITRDASVNDAVAPFRAEVVHQAFADSQAAGIIALAGGKSAPDWPLSWMFWRDFGTRYLLQLCQTQPSADRLEPLPPPDASILAHLTLSIPPMVPRFINNEVKAVIYDHYAKCDGFC